MPDARPQLFACDYCDKTWTSVRAAAACCDPELDDNIDRGRE